MKGRFYIIFVFSSDGFEEGKSLRVLNRQLKILKESGSASIIDTSQYSDHNVYDKVHDIARRVPEDNMLLLGFSGHGNGAYPSPPKQRYMDTDFCKNVIDNIGRMIDIILFDACLMANANFLRKVCLHETHMVKCKYVLASETTVTTGRWDYQAIIESLSEITSSKSENIVEKAAYSIYEIIAESPIQSISLFDEKNLLNIKQYIDKKIEINDINDRFGQIRSSELTVSLASAVVEGTLNEKAEHYDILEYTQYSQSHDFVRKHKTNHGLSGLSFVPNKVVTSYSPPPSPSSSSTPLFWGTITAVLTLGIYFFGLAIKSWKTNQYFKSVGYATLACAQFIACVVIYKKFLSLNS